MDLLEQRRYEERIEELEEEVRQLRALAFGDKQAPNSWGVSPAEEDILRALIAHPLCSKDRLLSAREARNRGSGEVGPNILNVFVCRLRKKGFPIRTKWGQGYYLDPVDRERFGAELLG
jgi:DNA-binding response OmpR family regulator